VASLAKFRLVAGILPRSLAILVLYLASSLVTGVSQTMSEGCPDSGVRIYVDDRGVITVNGQIVRPADLRQALASLKPPPTEVCYSRAKPQGEPPPEATVAIEAIIALRLPVAFYTDGTFRKRVKLQ
jgi:hypothetical protein